MAIQGLADFSGPDQAQASATTQPGVSFSSVEDKKKRGAPASYDVDAAADLVSQFESGNKNVPNYRYDVGHTASGFYQITDTNWNKYAPKVGIDTNKYPTAISAPKDLQKSVFAQMYTEQGFAPWANYNPRLAEAIGTGQLATPGWVASPQAYDAENRKSNTSLRYMSPEEYLSLLPPIEDDEASKAKKDNLNQSLAKGDNIEALPSLEVEPAKGDDLKVVDNDGRHRAQAAIDAGVDRIPVAINGASDDKDYKNLVGKNKKSLAYSDFKRVPPISAPEQAQKIAPVAFQTAPVQAQQNLATLPQAPAGPTPTAFDQAQAAATAQSPVPTKPDFYPQIAAGLNSDIYNPRGIGYRGVGVPDEATNVTARNRLAAANATSAGQVGLAPSSPASSLNSLLSNFNPISSAQAAEPAPSSPAIQGMSDFTPPQGMSDFTPPAQRQQPGSILPFGLESTVAAPVANALFAPLTADAIALGNVISGRVPRNMGGYQQARNNALNHISLPESPVGQAISDIVSSPARFVGWAAETILGPELSNKIAPYAQIGADLAPLLGLRAAAPIRNAIAGPISAALDRTFKTPEMRAAGDINRAYPAELQRGGAPAVTVQAELDKAKAAGIPVTPFDLSKRGGPLESLLKRSMENTPLGVASAEKFLKEREEGLPGPSSTEPVGGQLDRMTKEVEKHFGSGSFVDVSDALNKSMDINRKALAKKQEDLYLLEDKLKRAPTNTRLKQRQAKLNNDISGLNSQIAKESLDRESLDYGKNLLRDRESNRIERINQFLRRLRGTGTPDAYANLKLGLGDAIKHEYRKIRSQGKAPDRVNLPQDIKNKVSAVFGYDRVAANEFFDNVETEDLIHQRAKDLFNDIRSENRISELNKRKLRYLFESIGHFGLHLLWSGHGVFSPLYWAVKGSRQLADFLSTGGGSAIRHENIVNTLLDPNIRLNTTGKGLVNIPSRNALSQSRLNALSRSVAPFGAASISAANTQPAFSSP